MLIICKVDLLVISRLKGMHFTDSKNIRYAFSNYFFTLLKLKIDLIAIIFYITPKNFQTCKKYKKFYKLPKNYLSIHRRNEHNRRPKFFIIFSAHKKYKNGATLLSIQQRFVNPFFLNKHTIQWKTRAPYVFFSYI